MGVVNHVFYIKRLIFLDNLVNLLFNQISASSIKNFKDRRIQIIKSRTGDSSIKLFPKERLCMRDWKLLPENAETSSFLSNYIRSNRYACYRCMPYKMKLP